MDVVFFGAVRMCMSFWLSLRRELARLLLESDSVRAIYDTSRVLMSSHSYSFHK